MQVQIGGTEIQMGSDREATRGNTRPDATGKTASVAVGLLGGRNNFRPIIRGPITVQNEGAAAMQEDWASWTK